MPSSPEEETEEEAAQRNADHEQRMAKYKAEQERKEEERKAEFERQQKEYEAEQARRDKQRKARTATFERILENAPATLNAAQLRVLVWNAALESGGFLVGDDVTIALDVQFVRALA